MKKILFTLLTCVSILIKAQVPKGINYQAVIRDIYGTVITNSTVNMKFDIYNSITSTSSSYSETQSLTIGNTGIATCTIGSGSTVSGAFSAINWQGGDVAFEAFVDFGSGFTIIGPRQKFFTVPYAFYADKAGSAPSPTISFNNNILSVGGNTTTINTSSSYTAGNGISINSGIISNTAPFVVPTITGTGGTIVSGVYPNLTINSPTVSPAITPTITGIGIAVVSPNVGNNFTINVPTQTLALNGTILSVGSTTNSLNLIDLSPWKYSSNILYPRNNSATDRVAIGQTTSTAMLDIFNSNSIPALQSINSGTNYAGYFSNTNSTTVTKPTLFTQITSTSSVAFEAINANTTISGNGAANFNSSGKIPTIIATNSAYGSAAKFSSSSNNSFPTVYIESTNTNTLGIDAALFSKANIDRAILAMDSSDVFAAIQTDNRASGPSFYALKENTKSGHSIKAENKNPSNDFDVIYTKTNGKGAAIHATNDINTSTSALSLWIENGHLKASGSVVSIGTNSYAGGFSQPTVSVTPSSNDVRGSVYISTTASVLPSPSYIDVEIKFSKPYAIAPNITLTPLSDMQGLDYYISYADTVSFKIRLYKSINVTNTYTITSLPIK